jgi:hypothetical protein
MSIYSSEEQFYLLMQHLFERIRMQNPNPVDQLAAKRLIVRLRFSDPQAEIMVNGRRKPVSITFGGEYSPILPDLEAEMAAETLHMVLMHSLSLKSAIAYGKITVSGMLWRTKSLAAILEHGRAFYPLILREHGLIL